MTMKTLVLGGNQFLGVEILWQLLLAGHDVTMLAVDAPPREVAPHLRFVHVNRRDGAALQAALAGQSFDAVVDNIAYAPVDIELLLAALPGRIGRYFLTSTVDVYGHRFPRGYAEHQAPAEPLTAPDPLPYDVGKRGCEHLLRHSGVPWTGVRPCIVVGRRDNIAPEPYRHGIQPDEALSRAMFYPARVLDGGPILLRDDDEGVFRLVWSVDVARAVVHLLSLDAALGQMYNATADEIWTAERLVLAMYHAAGREPDLVRVSAAQLHQAGLPDYEPAYGYRPYWSIAENHKLRATGWRPTPAEDWLPRLLEADLAGRARAYYDRRHIEIALGQHVRRLRAQQPVLPPGAAAVEPVRVPGALEADESRRYVELAREPRPAPGHWKRLQDRLVSGIGLGTHMGDESALTDAGYVAAVVRAVQGGINVIDTAINYRNMKSERAVGQALRVLQREGIGRGAVLVSTKGGYVAADAALGMSWADCVHQAYVLPGLITAEEAARAHSLSAPYLRRSLQQSLRNLGLQQVDVYFLHNPEVARAAQGPVEFRRTLRAAFLLLEEAVAAGQVGLYGLATWDALRVWPEDPRHIALAEALEVAREVAGERHHFGVVQLPYNIRDAEALWAPTQVVGGHRLPALQAAAELGLYTFTSGTLLQGHGLDEERLARLRAATGGLAQPAALLQAARSVPTIGTALLGMRRVAHVEAALAVAALAPRPEILAALG